MKSNYFNLKNLILFCNLFFAYQFAKAQCNANFGYSTCVNGQMQYFNTSTGTNSLTSYNWNFGNSTTSTQQNPVATYSANGVYTVCLTIFNSVPSCSSTICQVVTINCVTSSCTANFTYSNCVNGQMPFSNTSTGTNSTTVYSWNFGNNTTSTAQNPTATYTANGNYTVCMSYTTASPSCTGNICNPVTINCVSSSSCQANFSYSNCVNGQIQFFNTSTGTNSITTYNWNFGNNTTSTQQNPIATYSANGIYTVCLTMYNPVTSCSNTACQVITINCVTSSCTPNFSYSNCVNGQMQFFNTSTGTNSTTVYSWTFGNSTNSTQQNPTATYTANGNYTVCMSYTTTSPTCTGNICKPVTINCVSSGSCSANFTYSNCVNGQMQFFNTSTGTNSLTTYSWIFGNSTNSNQQNPIATYSANGVYTVCLSIVSGSCSNTICKTVTINCVTSGSCTANFGYSTCVNGQMQFFNTSSGTNTTTTYSWIFGNSTSSNQQNPTATYTANGNYTVCLSIVTNSPNCSNTICMPVTINCAPNGIKQYAQESASIKIYPNPNNGVFTLDISNVSSAKNSVDLTVYNMLGVIVYQSIEEIHNGKVSKNMDLSYLPVGAYYMRVNSGNETYSVKTIITK